jgi:uncharacterized protein YcbK (DUF882 family)
MSHKSSSDGQSAPSPRRQFLRRATGLVAAATVPGWAQAKGGLPDLFGQEARVIDLVHTHRPESIGLVYAAGSRYLPESIQHLNWFLRDHYTGEVGFMDPQLFDQMHRIRQLLGTGAAYEVISGYRCPETNDRLRSRRKQSGVARHSLHMEGRAIDVRLVGVPLPELRDAALYLQAGGVGYYAGSDFVHLDTGPVRRW